MCPTGHSLFIGSDTVVGRLRWRAHARRCLACAEVRQGETLVAAAQARGGQWTRPTPTRVTRRWKLAMATAVVLVVALPLVSTALRRSHAGPFPPAVAALPEAQGIRTVHYMATNLTVSTTVVGAPFEAQENYELWIEYPDKMRSETTVVPWSADEVNTPQGSTRDGDRELVWGGGSVTPSGPEWDYWVARPDHPMLSPDVFAERGLPEFGMSGEPSTGIARLASREPPEDGEDVFERHLEPRVSGEHVVVVTHRKTGDPTFLGTYRTRIDDRTHLVAGWTYEIRATYQEDEAHRGREFTWTQTVDRVDYNSEFAPGLFGTDPPEGVRAIDGYTPAGLKQEYLWLIENLEDNKQRQSPEKWEQTRWLREAGGTSFNRLDVLSPADQEEIRARLKGLGIER